MIACATVIEEMLPLMPPNMEYEVLDFGLHVRPEELKVTLQRTINNSASSVKNIILGYGLCSQAVVGLKAEACTLIVPRVDDCIAIFLGSETAYRQQLLSVPGTYYLTKGWIKAGDTPFDEYDILVKRYGEVKARLIINQLLKNYTRLVLINTGQDELEYCRNHTRRIAEQFNLRYEEIKGSNILIKKMLYGQWDDNFVIANPGKTISFIDFKKVDQNRNILRKNIDAVDTSRTVITT
ncbi:DUF1638 domain-containing protein [Chloroflexota bacterium]